MEKICNICGKSFEQNENPEITYLGHVLGRDSDNERCYSCALIYVSGGFGPEGGDFNSARFISGEMSDDELQWFQKDQRSLQRRYREISDEEWYGVCQDCGYSLRECRCHDYEPEPEVTHYEDRHPEDWADTHQFTCMECGVQVPEWEHLCTACDTMLSTTNECVCGKRTESLKTFLCTGCDKDQKEWERRELEMLLDVHFFRAFWWRHLWGVINYHFLGRMRLRITLLRLRFFDKNR